MSSHLTNGICCRHFSFYLLWEHLPGVFGNSQLKSLFIHTRCLICVCLSLWACQNSPSLACWWPHWNPHKHKHKHATTYLTECTSPHKQTQDQWPQAHALWSWDKCQHNFFFFFYTCYWQGSRDNSGSWYVSPPLWSRMKYLCNYQMARLEIWYTHS